MLLTSAQLQQEVEAQVAGIGQLFRHQQGLHEKLLEQLYRLSELQQVVASIAAGLVGLPHPPTLTLQASLEIAVRLGAGFHLASGCEKWTAGELLSLFQRLQPLSLQMPVSLVKPGATSDGAIYEVGIRGEVITDAPLFSIERPLPIVYPC